jgi:U3 small nucleolar RNA-associated protein 13
MIHSSVGARYDAKLSQPLHNFSYHAPFAHESQVEVSVDESKVLCMFEENVSIIDLRVGGAVKQIFKTDETAEPVSCFTFHPSKEEVVVSTQKSSLMHVTTDGETLRTFKAHQMPVLCMAYDPTGTLVATGSADRTIRVWDMAGGFCTHSFRDHTDIVRTVTFHPDPQRLLLISTSDDNTVRVFDLRDSKCVAVFRTHVSLPTAVAFSPDGYLMASCGRDKVNEDSV